MTARLLAIFVTASIAAMIPIAGKAQTNGPMTSASPKTSDPFSGDALYTDVKHYESFGVHRYGTAGA